MKPALFATALLLLFTSVSPALAEVEVTFVVNDAFVKDKLLPGVSISVAQEAGGDPLFSGTTDDRGRLSALLAPGSYAVSYLCPGYVPLPDSSVSVHSSGQIITTTLSMMLEAEGSAAARRVRIILNWGSDPSQVKDADSHVICPCQGPSAHVFYVDMEHCDEAHSVNLDVDDRDWGGPETITLQDPPPGTYPYWVHDYSGPPAVLGSSDVVVRVLFDDRVAGEYHVPPTVTSRVWRPFKAVVVGQDLVPRMTGFSDAEVNAGMDLRPPPGMEEAVDIAAGGPSILLLVIAVVGLTSILLIARAIIRRFR